MNEAERDAFAAKYGWRPISEYDSDASYKRVVFLHWADGKPQICLRRQQTVYHLPETWADAAADTPIEPIVEWSTATHFKET